MMERYSRQTLFVPIGEQGQQEIQQKHVLLIGLGALGSSLADMLVRAGIGTLTIVDRDYVDWSNLGRQALYTEEDAANHVPKAIAAKNRLLSIRSDVTLHAHVMEAGPEELASLVHGVDLILDGTDQFDIRLIMNDIAMKYNIPWIYGACVGSYGMSYTILPGDTPCLHCLLQSVPLQGPTCDTAGVISPVVHLVTAHQMVEAMKLLTRNKKALRRELVAIDLWKNTSQSLQVDQVKRTNCPSCGSNASHPYLTPAVQTSVLCGRDTVQLRTSPVPLDSLTEALTLLPGIVKRNDFLVVYEHTRRIVFFSDGRVLIHGTKNPKEATAIYNSLNLHHTVM